MKCKQNKFNLRYPVNNILNISLKTARTTKKNVFSPVITPQTYIFSRISNCFCFLCTKAELTVYLQHYGDDAVFNKPQPAPRSKQQLEEAEKAYEFIEENPPEIKLSVYRLRRLADKKYEFCVDEEESENITPYRLAKLDSPSKTDTKNKVLPQQATMQELYIYTSPPFSPAESEDSSKVLRPLNSNLPILDNKNSPRSFVLAELASPGNTRSKKESFCCPAAEKKPVSVNNGG